MIYESFGTAGPELSTFLYILFIFLFPNHLNQLMFSGSRKHSLLSQLLCMIPIGNVDLGVNIKHFSVQILVVLKIVLNVDEVALDSALLILLILFLAVKILILSPQNKPSD